MNHGFRTGLCLAAVCALVSPARAAFFTNATGLSNPDRTITFDEIALSAVQQVDTQFADVTFVSAWANPDANNYPNISGNRIANFTPGAPARAFSMDFANPVGAVAFALVTAPGTTTFNAFLGGVLVETATRPTTFVDNVDFFGFRDVVFDRVSIAVESSDHALQLDNLQISAVPEPQTSALLLLGVGLLVALLKPQRRMKR